MTKFVTFRCPATGASVQSRLPPNDDQLAEQRQYEAVFCQACAKVHFVNSRTGKLFGLEKE